MELKYRLKTYVETEIETQIKTQFKTKIKWSHNNIIISNLEIVSICK